MSNELTPMEEKIAARINPETTSDMMMSDGSGGVALANMGQVMEFAKMMAIAQIGVRKHLRGNPGACLAVCVQALEWRMSPFQVANKSYAVNDQIAYEASLIHAVVQSRAPIKGRVKVEYSGTGPTRKCRVWGELADGSGEIVEYESPELQSITTKNSPLWKSDPDQQLFYFGVRSWCRRHFPDVILGVYTPEDIAYSEPLSDDRSQPSGLKDRLLASHANSAGFSVENINRETGEVTSSASVRQDPAKTGTQGEEEKKPAPISRSPAGKAAEPQSTPVGGSAADLREQTPKDLAWNAGYQSAMSGGSLKDIPPQYGDFEELAGAYEEGFANGTDARKEREAMS